MVKKCSIFVKLAHGCLFAIPQFEDIDTCIEMLVVFFLLLLFFSCTFSSIDLAYLIYNEILRASIEINV